MSSAEFAGSCLCGAVSYEITGTPFDFFHCHCHRCRKANGTGHASNILLKLESVKWTAGEDNRGGYKVPGAKRFRTSFCKSCGSPVPRIATEMAFAVIPAGSLDTEPPLQPTARIFWDSRTDWSCAEGDVPVWSEYPEKP